MTKRSILAATILLGAGTASANDPPTPPDLPGTPSTETPQPAEPDAAPPSDAAPPTSSVELAPAPLRPEDRDLAPTAIRDPAYQSNEGVATVTPVAPPAPPLVIAGSAFAAGYGYSGHPTRTGGFESQARTDVWRGLEWGAHVSYTLDVIEADDEMTGSRTATAFHDVDFGGSMLVTKSVPTWAFLEGHVLGGAGDYAGGAAFMLGAGRLVGPVKVELGAGAILTNGDNSLTAALHVARPRITPWLGGAITAVYTNDGPRDSNVTTGGSKLAAGPELTFGPFRNLTFVVDGLFGSRSFALLSRGQVVENVPDVQHTTLRTFVWLTLSERTRVYVGGSYRTGTAPIDKDYTLASGFAGGIVSF